MRTTFAVQFYCRFSKVNKQGLAPIELSLIINGERVFVQLLRKERPAEFKKALQSKKSNPTKEFLEEIRRKFYDIETELMRENIPVTASSLREYYRTGGIKRYTLDSLFTEYLNLLKKRVGHTLTPGAYRRYEVARNTFYRYVDPQIPVQNLTPSTIQNFLVELQSQYQDSTTCSIMTRVKTVLEYAHSNGEITINLFSGVKYGKGQKEVTYLDEDEIHRLMTKDLHTPRLDRIRDLAIFQINSGLAYIDTQLLTPGDIKTIDGITYIQKPRQKTGTEFTSVVLSPGVEILRKYNYELPKISNQKMNAFLKEIQELCNIQTNLTTHLFRRTYATRLLNSGVRLETVSKALGHSSTTITQQAYAKVLKETVISEIGSAMA